MKKLKREGQYWIWVDRIGEVEEGDNIEYGWKRLEEVEEVGQYWIWVVRIEEVEEGKTVI